MNKYLKIPFSIIKIYLRSKLSGVLNGRYFEGVEFKNKNNISVDEKSFIEKGARIYATDPTKTEYNICIEAGCWIGRDVEIQTVYDSKIVLKRNVSIQDRCKILGSVYIGQDSLLAPDVFLSSGNHYYNHQPALTIKQQDELVVRSAEDFRSKNSPVVIEEDCWLGKNSLVTSGVNIGRGAIIGANSFVNRNVPPYEIWAGSPAKCIKKRLEFKPPLAIEYNQVEHRPYFYRGFDHRNTNDGGFVSSGSAVCVLEISDRISLILSGEIYAEGMLKIWENDNLVYNNNVIPGPFAETLIFEEKLNDTFGSALYQSLPDNIKCFLCVIFEFKPQNSEQLKGFSIKKMEQHD